MSGGRGLVSCASGLASILLHGALFGSVISWFESDPGAIHVPVEAASVELLQTEITEVAEATNAATATASQESVQARPGETTESAAASIKAPQDLKLLEPTETLEASDASVHEVAEADGMEILTGALVEEVPIGVERPDTKPAPDQRDQSTREPKRRQTNKKVASAVDSSEKQTADGKPTQKGGSSTRARKSSASSAGRLSASTGSVINYAAVVRARVASRRPGGGGHGTVLVFFAITNSGGLSFARVAKSSGDLSLDHRVLAAVQGAAPFPAPPPGANHTFAIPFYFK